MPRKETDLDYLAMKIVNRVSETHGVDWKQRQDKNDELFDYAKAEIRKYVKQSIFAAKHRAGWD